MDSHAEGGEREGRGETKRDIWLLQQEQNLNQQQDKCKKKKKKKPEGQMIALET